MSLKNLPKILHNFSKINSLATDISEEIDIDEIEVQLELLEENWKEYKKYETKLPDAGDDTCTQIEDIYTKTKVLLRRALRKMQEARQPWTANVSIAEVYENQKSFMENITLLTKTSSSDIKLPQINIPTFNGNYADFPSFRDLFESTVHNNKTLPDVHKFQYLKGLLRDDAAVLVKHIALTSANYKEAWKKIIERYDQKQAIINEFIQKFLEQPTATQRNPKSIRNLCDTSDEVIRGLKALGTAAEARDPWLIYILLTKLDTETRHIWNRENNNESPTISDFFRFLSNHCNSLEMCEIGFKKPSSSKQYNSIKGYHTTTSPTEPDIPVKPTARMCKACDNINHQLYQCPSYIKMDADTRYRFVTTNNFCFNCLYSNHLVQNCPSTKRCIHCKRKHHTTLHFAKNESEEQSQPRSQSIESTDLQLNSPSESAQTYHASLNTIAESRDIPPFNSLLPTAMILITNKFGKPELCRALLDSGSQASMISESCMQRLQLPRYNARVSITGIASSASSKGIASITVTSNCTPITSMQIDALIMNNINSLLPTSKVEISNWDHLKSLKLADPHFNQPQEIDLLIGADHFINILKPGKIQGPKGSPSAQETIFGWIIAGEHFNQRPNEIISLHVSTENIDKSLRKFWEIEEMNSKQLMSPEEEKCEEHFLANYSRDPSGRYTVKLPFRQTPNSLGESLHCAISRIQSVEKKLSMNQPLKEEYVKFMAEYISLGHMEEISDSEDKSTANYYLPHHAVIKSTSTTTKVRVVFDGSSKTSNGISLNEILMVGPTIQPDLSSILLRFRQHRIAFSADIEKMYRQIQVSPEDSQFQRTVWRDNPSNPIKHYKLKTVTYGTSSASYLAIRTLQQISYDEQHNYPIVASIIRDNFYVDDLLSGAENIEQATAIKQQLQKVLHSGGFILRKWSSNSPQLMLNESTTLEEKLITSENEADAVKLLDLQWNASTDNFSFNVNVDIAKGLITKRKFLSEASRIFDPLGWLSPAIIKIKIMFQKLWLLGIKWDEDLPTSLSLKWQTFKAELKQLENLKINRFLSICRSKPIQFHGFCDASELAYSAVIYVRGVNDDGEIQTTLVCAKTKVSPVKQVSLPRLELCGAQLLAKLISNITKTYDFKDFKIYTWTDSTIVLHWLSDIPRRWKTYIANRTSEILNIIPRTSWKHISSKENPADCASRGLTPTELLNFNLWWEGPVWLKEEESYWPNKINIILDPTQNTEERQSDVLIQHTTCDSDIENYLCKFSYTKMIRVLSYCFRFITNMKNSNERKNGPLSSAELQNSITYCIKWAQRESFFTELQMLAKEKNVPHNSKLKQLAPFIDVSGVIRVGGRLQNSTCSYDVKHPIILSSSHILSKMIVQQYHIQYLHSGPSLLSHIIRQKYWIIGGRNLIRHHIQKCLICFRYKAAASKQLMGNLPASRITPARSFSKCGVDYLGPIEILARKGRGAKCHKAYVAVFVCMSTKAIHIELVNDLTSDSFIAALKRLISRRGLPSDIYSDNGTNFIGAKRKIDEVYRLCLSSSFNHDVSEYLATQEINWHFIPPFSPSMGGVWEAAVKSIKHHLLRVTYNTKLTTDEMSTLLCQIESILNSRPLCPMPENDIENFDALTAAHFIIGGPLIALPEQNLDDFRPSILSRWQNITARIQSFWKRYNTEYINNLQQRQKWNVTQHNLTIGDLVLLKESNLPPSNWLLGRVIDTHPGTDDLVRVVTVKTSKSILKRAISKLVKLPVD